MQLNGAVPLFQVFDMNEAVGFYRDLLGFEVLWSSDVVETAEGRYFDWCWLGRGPVEIMLNTAYDAGQRPDAREPERWAGHADTTLCIGCADVDDIHADFTLKGLQPGPLIEAHAMRQFSLKDPDGYVLMFQQRL